MTTLPTVARSRTILLERLLMVAKTVKRMSSEKTPSTKMWWILGGVVAAAAAAWGISAGSKAEQNGVPIPAEFSVDALKARTDSGARFTELRETLRRDDLNDEQKRQIVRNMGEARRARMQARVDEYFSAPPEEQTTILDRHIDEMQQMFQQFERQRGSRAEGAEEKSPNEEERDSLRRLMAPQSRQDRKARSESHNPDETARTMAYFGAMRTRAAERGIQMPRGPRRGGGSGGRRGGPFGP